MQHFSFKSLFVGILNHPVKRHNNRAQWICAGEEGNQRANTKNKAIQ